MKADKATTTEVYEPFERADGKRVWAWVTWRIGDGERRAIAVRLTERPVEAR